MMERKKNDSNERMAKRMKNKGYKMSLKRMLLLGTALLACMQPVTAYAGPSGDTKETQKKGPASDDIHSSSMNAGGPGSVGLHTGTGTGTSAFSDLKLPLRPASGYGISAVLGGLKTFVPYEEEAKGAIARGIDVSYWNQNIDWKKAAADNVQFAMLATRFRGEEDPFFSANADAASKEGIRLGAYLYSYATTVQMAEEEADFVLRVIKDYPISFPVVFDAEDAGTLGTLSPSEISQIIQAFCNKIAAAGYYPMVYANDYWVNNKIDMSALNYDVWVARYQERYTYASPAMWQASNTGSVNGISGNVDINYLYKDYSQIIPGTLWRNISGSWYYYKDHAMQRKTWIQDAGSWYYLNEEGKMLTGWQEIGDERYLLDASGKMLTGWQSDASGLYYLNPSTGAMVKNTEFEENGMKYRADERGFCTKIEETEVPAPEAAPVS